jgi:UDP-N-acetylenolpyruvoylglucosamine reductase
MRFPDITPELRQKMPQLRGRLVADQPLASFTWFRTGGPAQAFFTPMDEDDLSYFLQNLPHEIPLTLIGAGSNMIIRDGGVPGVVMRLVGKLSPKLQSKTKHVFVQARLCRMSKSRVLRLKPALLACPSFAAFPVASVVRCA